MSSSQTQLSLTEFVVLIALMISIVALATDVMLPALDMIGRDLGVADINDTQLVISSLFLGFAIGQLFAGPLSDRFGRKPVIYFGYFVFIAGCLLAIFATDFSTILVGRVLQGLGAAFPRIVTLALVRDCYEGRAMARIMSVVMAIFIIVPTIAPAIGQGVIALAGWRATFVLLLLLAVICFVWFGTRQPETLASESRRALSPRNIFDGVGEFVRLRSAFGYTIATGLVFGPFMGYLSSAQQLFQSVYQTGHLFALYFGIAALSIGAASAINAKLVMQLGMRLLCWRALIFMTVCAVVFFAVAQWFGGIPTFWLFMAWLMMTFFCVGILFGNFSALAMESLGHMAGLGAALFGFLSTMIGLPLGWGIGKMFAGNILPLVGGFALLGVVFNTCNALG